MADEKPLKRDGGELRNFTSTDVAVVGGVKRPAGNLTLQDGVTGPHNLIDLVDSGGGFAVKYGSNATATAGKWLEIHRNILSNEVPFIVPEATTLVAITAAVKTTATITFGVYKNGSQIDTLVFTAVKKGTKASLTHSLVASDELSVKVESGSGADPVLHLILE